MQRDIYLTKLIDLGIASFQGLQGMIEYSWFKAACSVWVTYLKG